MDLKKIEIRKKKIWKLRILQPKTLNSYYMVIPIFPKPFTGRIDNHPVDEEVFWKTSSAQRLWH